MKRIPLLLLPLLLAACQPKAEANEQPPAAAPAPDPNSPVSKIMSATSAGPASISAAAAVMDMGADGSMSELRAGKNGWTCLPDMPNTPGNDPMCLDAQAMAWAGAWMTKATPKLSADGLAYMLQGGSDPSNDDPFATMPSTGMTWVETGPHVMVMPVNARSLDKMSNDPKAGGPFVMFRGTPYAHVMMPVR
jgi:hypothetical protein